MNNEETAINEGYAEAFGYKKTQLMTPNGKPYADVYTHPDGNGVDHDGYCPNFAYSIDVITKEIERRGLMCGFAQRRLPLGDIIRIIETEAAVWKDTDEHQALRETIPLALCDALKEYIENEET